MDATSLRVRNVPVYAVSKDEIFWDGRGGPSSEVLQNQVLQELSFEQAAVKTQPPPSEMPLSVADSMSPLLPGSEMSCAQPLKKSGETLAVTLAAGIEEAHFSPSGARICEIGAENYADHFETLSESSAGESRSYCLQSPGAPSPPESTSRSSSSTNRSRDAGVHCASSSAKSYANTSDSGLGSMQSRAQGPRSNSGTGSAEAATSEVGVTTATGMSSLEDRIAPLDAASLDRTRAKIRERLSPIYKIPGPDRYARGADQTVKYRRRVLQNRLSGRISRELAKQKLISLEREASELELRLEHLMSEESQILQQTYQYRRPSYARPTVEV